MSLKSKKYRDFVVSLPCICCSVPPEVIGIDPHHINVKGLGKGTGSKISDIFCIPLCRRCHTLIHKDSNMIDQMRAALLTIEKAVVCGVLDVK